MKSSILLCILLLLITFAGCYTTEDAADVNQDRIKANYCTTFNATHGTTNATISFLFGQTPLRLSNKMYFNNARLSEKEDLIFGLHYGRLIDNILSGNYEWTDEDGNLYSNNVTPYSFNLTNPLTELKKYTYYKIPWGGQDIPNGSGQFQITVKSLEENITSTFSTTQLLEIHSEDLANIPAGRAIVTISRYHTEPVEIATQAGGKSTVYFEREFDALIIN